MSDPLTIHGWGAVTPVGLNSAQSCTAIRARISAFREVVVGPPPVEPQVAAPIAAKRFLKRSPTAWLTSLAARAIAESLRGESPAPERTVLIVAPPEPFRDHPGTSDDEGGSFLSRIESYLKIRFHHRSFLLSGGPAALFQALQAARALLRDPSVDYCLIGGVDSLINEADLARLAASHRLRAAGNPQGLVPGEGASFVLVSADTRWQRCRPLGQLLGVGVAMETNTVLGAKYSIGDGLQGALTQAAEEIKGGEPTLEFVVSTFNGERYGAWEAQIARGRFYRTRRERLTLIYPAMSVGDMGTAAPMLSVIVATTAIARGYAPGHRAMCETSSDEGLRGACVVGPSPDPPAFAAPGHRAS